MKSRTLPSRRAVAFSVAGLRRAAPAREKDRRADRRICRSERQGRDADVIAPHARGVRPHSQLQN